MGKKHGSEHVLAVVKAGVSAVPMVGGAIASLVGDYVPTATQRTIEDATRRLGEKLEELEERLNVDAVNKDEFSELFKSSYLLLQRSHQKEKIDAALALIINLLLEEGDEDKLSYTELDHFSRCLDLLSIGALRVLRVIYQIHADIADRPETFKRRFSLTLEGLNSHLKDLDPSLLMGLLAELAALNLVYLPPAPAIVIVDHGNQDIKLTPLGVRFVNHLLAIWWGQS